MTMTENTSNCLKAIWRISRDLPQGQPSFWNEAHGTYDIDIRETPEQYIFQDTDERFYVLTDGTIERYDNRPVTIEELEITALTVLAALKKAYHIREQGNRA